VKKLKEIEELCGSNCEKFSPKEKQKPQSRSNFGECPKPSAAPPNPPLLPPGRPPRTAASLRHISHRLR
ncbi:hypothetical protein HN51_001521, partial [Arachis hypogaea]